MSATRWGRAKLTGACSLWIAARCDSSGERTAAKYATYQCLIRGAESPLGISFRFGRIRHRRHVETSAITRNQTELGADTPHRVRRVLHDPPQRTLDRRVFDAALHGVVAAHSAPTVVVRGSRIAVDNEQVEVPGREATLADQVRRESVPDRLRTLAELHRRDDGGRFCPERSKWAARASLADPPLPIEMPRGATGLGPRLSVRIAPTGSRERCWYNKQSQVSKQCHYPTKVRRCTRGPG